MDTGLRGVVIEIEDEEGLSAEAAAAVAELKQILRSNGIKPPQPRPRRKDEEPRGEEPRGEEPRTSYPKKFKKRPSEIALRGLGHLAKGVGDLVLAWHKLRLLEGEK